MKNIKWISLLCAFVFLGGCDVKMGPSDWWDELFTQETDSKYYKKKSEKLVSGLTENVKEYEINKVVVLDFVDDEGRVPVLGEYMSNRVVEAITRNQHFRVAQRGEVLATLEKLGLHPSFQYTRKQIQSLGRELNVQGVVNGKVRDIGSNIDVHVVLVDIASGEVISSASERLNRTRFAVELLNHYPAGNTRS